MQKPRLRVAVYGPFTCVIGRTKLPGEPSYYYASLNCNIIEKSGWVAALGESFKYHMDAAKDSFGPLQSIMYRKASIALSAKHHLERHGLH